MAVLKLPVEGGAEKLAEHDWVVVSLLASRWEPIPGAA